VTCARNIVRSFLGSVLLADPSLVFHSHRRQPTWTKNPGTLDKVRTNFGVWRASLGSLSKGVAVFDPEPLNEIAQELFDQLPDVSAGRFGVMGQTLTAVDGSVVETLARVARLAWLPKAKGASLCGYRLHTRAAIDCTHGSRCCVG
jgi:hypothetical protein